MKANKNKVRILKFFSASLALVMLLASLPTVIFAEGTSLGSMSADSNASLSGSEAFLEDESMRDKFSKHYVLEDGSRFAVVFPEAVHYDDGNEWKEVDNRLTYNSKTGKYVSANPMFTTAFADNAASGELVSISDGEYTVSWSISFNKTVGNELVQVAASNSAASVQNGADVAEKLSEVKRLQASRGDAVGIAAVGTSAGTSPESVYKNTVTDLGKALSGISYENALDGAVSLRYSVMHQKIEEDIILRSKSDFASYTLTVNTGGLTVIAEDDGSIIFRNASGEAVFTIDAPWMQDSAYGFSKDIAVTVAQTGNTATVTYTPSAEWLSDEDRVYPVLIDPTFTTRDYTANYVDTHVLSGETDYTYYDDMQSLYAGSSPVGEWKSYIKFLNIPNISEDTFYRITSASFQIWTTSSYNFPLTLSEVVSPWIGQTNISEPSSRLISDSVSAAYDNDETYKYTFDLSSFFDMTYHDWGDYTYYWENIGHGFKIEGATSGSDTATVLNSSEAADHRPILTLSYTSGSNYFLNTDGVYSLKGYGTSNYMTTYNGGVSNGTNVCMGSPVSISTSLAQSYRFEYIAATETWKIHAMTIANGYDKVIGFSYEDTVSDYGGYIPANVELYPSNADNECIEWIIEPMSDTRFKIVSAYDPNLVLSFYGTSSWTSGSLPTSVGNICVAQYVPSTSSGTNPGQYWELYSGGTMVTNGDNIAEIQTLEMNEDETYSFDVTVYGGYQRVSWSSSDSSIASVSNGQVTANGLGEVTITATVCDEWNVILNTYSVTLRIVLEDSVYYVNNFADTTLFIQYSGEDKYTADLGSDTRPCMFKIYHLGDGKYSIRSMYDNKYGFTRSDDGELVHEEVGTEQEFYSNVNTNGVPEESQWRILGSADDGYVIKNILDVNGYVTLTNTGKLSLGALATSNAAQKWNLTKSGFSGTGIEIYPSSTAVAVGQTKQLELAFYSSNMNKNAPSNVTWSITSGNDKAIINSATGEISGLIKGDATVKAFADNHNISYTITIFRHAVFLIHGRNDNSFTVWGANNGVYVNPYNPDDKNNNHYNSALNAGTIGGSIALYTQVSTQRLQSYAYDTELTIESVFNGEYTGDENVYLDTHSEGGNLAYYLTQQGYTPNVDLFVFNYPNQDAVKYNAQKLNAYLDNLAAEIRTSGTAQQKASFFGKTSGITASSSYNIDIVGHSMGGLVARYYIENLDKDHNVRKLITIGTPHWGSGLADLSCALDATSFHLVCDHDLMADSKIFGGANTEECKKSDLPHEYFTDTLDYSGDRDTMYYAIASFNAEISYSSELLSFEISTIHISENSLCDNIRQNSGINFSNDSILNSKDNTVELLSQIGWKDSATKIQFNKIFVVVDTNGGNSLTDHLHGKIPHKIEVMGKIFEYLNGGII